MSSKPSTNSLVIAALGAHPPETATLEALAALDACDKVFEAKDAKKAWAELSKGRSVGIKAAPGAPSKDARMLLERAAAAGIPVRSYAGVSAVDRWLAETLLVLGHDVDGVRINGGKVEAVRPAVTAHTSAPVLKGSRVFVTGGTGFIGSHLVRVLLSAGALPHLLVRDLKSPALKAFAGRVSVHQGDIETPASLVGAVRAARPEIVLSLAAVRGEGTAIQDDIDATLSLAAALRSGAPGLKRWVRTGLRLVEGFGKAEEDALDRRLRSEFQLPVTTLRLFRIYGPGGDLKKPGRDPKQVYVHVDDVCAAFARAAVDPDGEGRTFDVR